MLLMRAFSVKGFSNEIIDNRWDIYVCLEKYTIIRYKVHTTYFDLWSMNLSTIYFY